MSGFRLPMDAPPLVEPCQCPISVHPLPVEATGYTWHGGTINYDSPAFWASVPSFETLSLGTSPTTGTVPNGSHVNAGLVAGEISPFYFSFYSARPRARRSLTSTRIIIRLTCC